jgi:hypothetical protein
MLSSLAGFPHATTEGDVYEGFFILKGVLLPERICPTFADTFYPRCGSDRKYMVHYVPSALATASTVFRAILHDPELYPEPDIFKPERFPNPGGSLRDDPNLTSVYGFGKRICPGRHLVDATLFIVVASLFSVFNFERGR